ncbi:MAG: DUF4149 domain-containing protein, partial [Isosphaeraceae bacterium]
MAIAVPAVFKNCRRSVCDVRISPRLHSWDKILRRELPASCPRGGVGTRRLRRILKTRPRAAKPIPSHIPDVSRLPETASSHNVIEKASELGLQAGAFFVSARFLMGVFDSVYLIALTAWVGSILFVSFGVAPLIFRVLSAEDAGKFVRALLPRYY